MIKTLASFLILALFVFGIGFYGTGAHALFPSLRLLQDTQWDFSLLWEQGSEKVSALFLLIPISFGFVGWTGFLQNSLFPKVENRIAKPLAFSLSISLFSIYVFGLSINEILYGPLVFLFFVPALWRGWLEWKGLSFSWEKIWKDKRLWLFALPFFLWFSEYLSAPIIWDAILDHFRYAREVSRLHQIPFHWINHTGDMPKGAELVLAGFWSMGGETFSKLSSSLAAVCIIWLLCLFSREWKGSAVKLSWIFLTTPIFLALFSWGYVEGFLALYELLAVYCLWKVLVQPEKMIWPFLTAFSLGFAFAIKYTALLALAPIAILWLYGKFRLKRNLKINWLFSIIFIVPLFPWLLKGWLAYGNPLYPLATSLFGTPFGYGPGMERDLWQDTGLAQGLGVLGRLSLFWKAFFTSENGIAASWTPLFFMSLPWAWKVLKDRLGAFLALFSAMFLGGWIFLCTNLRHASGGTMGLILLAAMAWEAAFRDKKSGSKFLFVTGTALSFWLCLSAQLTTTAPYASALGLEDPLLRLKRHYTYDTDTYTAYRFIENHSDPRDKVMAFAVFQTYPLQRTAYVDFKWKRPIFLQWASRCQTAEQLAQKLHEEGVEYFLYQQWEATAMSRMERDFTLEGMPVQEYVRFWECFMEPVERGENSIVYKIRKTQLKKPRKLDQLPGLQEKRNWKPDFNSTNA